jgi:hypothetical protein
LLSPDFIDILSAFTEEQVEYLLVGSYAMALHGYARATGDIDLWVRPTPENAYRVMTALTNFGAPLADLTRNDLAIPGTVFQIGISPNRIDVITDIDAVEFDEAWQRRESATVGGLTIPLISKSLLIKNKKSTGRPKDQLDVLWLEDE